MSDARLPAPASAAHPPVAPSPEPPSESRGAGQGARASARFCWVCGGATHPYFAIAALEAVACGRCGHVLASHQPPPGTGQGDYHLAHASPARVAALRATRRRQAARVLDALGALARPPRSLFDFGCGRPHLLQVARERGALALAGGDVSGLALDLVAQLELPALRLDARQPFEKLELARLPFVPEVITLLDVLEHFSGDLGARLGPWLRGLPPGVRHVVLKVPVRDGLLFSCADLARRAGKDSLALQLFQSGTHPPHYQYFTRRSLDALVRGVGLQPVVVLDDLDFEPGQLGRRLTGAGRAVRLLAPALGHCLGAAARATGRLDSRIVIAARPT